VTPARARTFIKPHRLRSGDRIALVAPASAFRRDDLDAGVTELRRLGFDAVYDQRVFERQRFVAGEAATRAALIEHAWRDSSIRALMAIRGGYGSAQLLPLLDTRLMRDARKVFIGYSDITALLCQHLRYDLACFHGAMIERRIALGEDGYHRPSLLACISEAQPAGEMTPPGLEVLKHGEARGVLVGGTMTQLVSLLGTPWAYMPPDGCLLFLEDVAERPYRIDRMLTQLKQAGVLEKASAIVFGEFPDCNEPGDEVTARHVAESFAVHCRGPVLFGFPSGHTKAATWTLPLGVEARVVTSGRAALVIEESAVE
jgi:muramoyltetrapeptide carboxypeptidase